MSIFQKIKQRLVTSFAQRSGLLEMQKRLLSIEEKIDWLMKQQCMDVKDEEIADTVKKINKKPEKNAFPVAFITDKSYFDTMLLAAWTLVEHQDTPYQIYFLLSSCSEEQKQYATCLFPHAGIQTVPESQLPFTERSGSHLSKTTLLKFALPNFFPDLDRLLFLDCDVLIQGDLHELQEWPLDNSPLAAVRDAAVIHSPYFQRTIFPLSHSHDYINAGVMLLNLKYMRDNNCIPDLEKMAFESPHLAYHEQDILNILFADKMSFLPPKYNSMPKVSSDGMLTDLQLAEIHKMSVTFYQKQKVAIYHLAGPDKPWNTSGAFKYTLWREEKERFEKYCKLFKLN